jgi:branched-subunit amino acid transport protein
MSATFAAALALSALTMAIKSAGSLVPRIPQPVARRLGGLAPALLAGLVVTELVGSNGLPAVDARLAGVAVAVVLTWRRAPVLLAVVAGAAVAAILRAVS